MKKEELQKHMKDQGFKFWVLKIEDFINALSEVELQAFDKLLQKYEEYRVSLGKKPTNNYWVVNRDDTPIANLDDFLRIVKAKTP